MQLRQSESSSDHDYCHVPNVVELSIYKEAAVSYIAGDVVRMVEKKIHCMECIAALTMTKEKIPDLFVMWKTNGGLKLPSHGLLKICQEKEVHSKNAKLEWWLPVCVESEVYSTLNKHMFV